MKRLAYGVAVFSALGLAATIGFRSLAAGPVAETLLTAPVQRGDIEETVLANGTLEPIRMVNVGAQVTGKVRALHFGLGQAVKTGDLIAEIDSLTQTNALRIAEAALANVKAQHTARSIQLRQAQSVFNRLAGLAREKATSRQELEAAQATAQALEADVAALDAQVDQAAVAVENARVSLDYTRIVAPIDGVVIAVVTKEGQTLNSNQSVPTIVVLAQMDVMRVKVQISEADVGRTKPEQKVWFTVLGDPKTRHEARLRQIEIAPTSMSTESGVQTAANAQGTAAIYYNGLLEVANKDGHLRPQMTAQVHIVLGSAEDVLLVPWSALSERADDGRYRVRVRKAGGTTEERLVAIGLSDKMQAQVIDGLSVGDEVVITVADTAPDSFGGMM